MNLNLDINELDFDNIGAWPTSAKVVSVIITSVFILLLGGWLDTRRQIDALNISSETEIQLRTELETKQHQASNLEAYREQMKEMKATFGALLRQLPEKTEVPGLVEDISHQGLATGLTFRSLRLQAEKQIDFYVELPIQISVYGRYHQLGEFISQVASLPRIVTLHDFTVVPAGGVMGPDILQLDIVAKTYRYSDAGAP